MMVHRKKVHSVRKSYECQFCQKTFNHSGNWRSLVQKRHIEISVTDPESQKFFCEICQKRFKLKRDLKVHFKEEHPESQDVEVACNVCQILFRNVSGIYFWPLFSALIFGVNFRPLFFDQIMFLRKISFLFL